MKSKSGILLIILAFLAGWCSKIAVSEYINYTYIKTIYLDCRQAKNPELCAHKILMKDPFYVVASHLDIQPNFWEALTK